MRVQNYIFTEYMSKIGQKIELTPFYSPWSNSTNERNHYSADIIIKKIMEGRKILKTDTIIKAAVQTYNTIINKLD